MRVLEVFGEPISYGGQESFVVNLLTHMDLNDMQVDLLTPYYCDNDYYRSVMKNLGINIYSFELEFTPGKSRANIKDKLDAFLKKNQYDVVHVHSGSISILRYVAEVSKRNNIKKVIVHSHSSVEKITLKNIILRTISSFSFNKNVDVYCACSKIAGKAKFLSSVTNERLIVIKNGVDLDKFKFNENIKINIRKKHDIPIESVVIGHVGRFSYEKNHEKLVRVFNAFLKINTDAVLMMIGVGENEENIRFLVNGLGISDKVRFIGKVTNVNEYMQAMDLFLFPSRFEGLGIVGIEAQAVGIPVVASTKVSPELNITQSVSYISLDECDEIWANEISERLSEGKNDNSAKIRNSGYDMFDTSEKVRNIYFN